jgi:hypothetical protein
VSNLRKQLDGAQSDYFARRYPGNLAEEILPGRSNRLRLMAYAAPLLAAAAALLIYVGTGHFASSPSGKSPVAFNPAPDLVVRDAGPTTTASISNDTIVPQFVELTPSVETISLSATSSESFSVPAIQLVPSWDDDAAATSTSSTTQESAI